MFTRLLKRNTTRVLSGNILMVTPDFVLVDINMPAMTGFEFYKKLQAVESAKTIPVFFFSTSSFTTDIEKARNLGASGFVSKSISYQELWATIAFPDWQRKSNITPSIQLFI